MKKVIFYATLLVFGCSKPKKDQSKLCETKLYFINTGQKAAQQMDSLLSDGQRDTKWLFCKVDYPDTNYVCDETVQALVKDSKFSSRELLTDNPVDLDLPAAAQNTKWVIADDGQMVHSMPYFHVFESNFRLSQEEVENSEGFNLSISTFDSPLEKVTFNDNVLYRYTGGNMVFNLPDIKINQNLLKVGVNALKIVTTKTDLTRDDDTTDDNLIKTQYSALNVSGYLKVLKPCN